MLYNMYSMLYPPMSEQGIARWVKTVVSWVTTQEIQLHKQLVPKSCV